FAMNPVVYDFTINETGTAAELLPGLMPPAYYSLHVPALVRRDLKMLPAARRTELETFAAATRTQPAFAGVSAQLVEALLPGAAATPAETAGSLDALLAQGFFDRLQHERIRTELRAGRIGLAQNRLPVSASLEDSRPDDVVNALSGLDPSLRRSGEDALRAGAVGVISLAGGAGSRRTRGAGVVKALNPFARFGGKWRNFIEVHLAKSRRTARQFGAAPPHIITTSYLTDAAIRAWVDANPGPIVSPGRYLGLRLVPMVRDLRFAWEEMPQQLLDEQKQKVRDSLHAALIGWAEHAGEGCDYTDNLPAQCLHPVGHFYEVPNLLRNGVLRTLLAERPQLRWLMMHNIDTLGADLDPALLGLHMQANAALTFEVIPRVVDDRGGGLARVDGRLRLVEGLAMPDEESEFRLTWYNSATTWIDIDRLLTLFGLTRDSLTDDAAVANGIRRVAAHVPTYITLKDVKKRWGHGQEDVFPVAQFEKLWGDLTALTSLDCRFAAVPRRRGQQLKDVAQLDGWLRDGSAAYVDSLCDWNA
ncbi:MAG: UTP--glucose-1-phosphate uridylyltransferase, partial [Bryobacter sp.]|nr:UTP--glucose-1-phosphate uridylyltransferase [Bryobacter sp.]